MGRLKVRIDNNGDTGMCNILMGIDVALSVAVLTNRNGIDFFLEKKIFNSGYSLDIFDLYDISYPYTVNYGDVDEDYTAILCYGQNDLGDTVFYHLDKPDENFVNERKNLFDLSALSGEETIFFYPKRTLASFSYLFFLSNFKKKNIIDFLKNAVKPKDKYTLLASAIVNEIRSLKPNFRSIHLRRGDFLAKQNVLSYDASSIQRLPFINGLSFDNCITVVHSYHSKGSDLDFIDSSLDFLILEEYFSPYFVGLNDIEIGLVSMIVASESDDFVGTMSSTFTSTIQKLRKYAGKQEYFRYLFSEKEGVALNSIGCIIEKPFGIYSWNRRDFSKKMPEYFWYFENRECYVSNYKFQHSVRVFPNFLKEGEIYYILNMVNSTKNFEFLAHENRDKYVFGIRENKFLNDIRIRVSEELGYDRDSLENELQVFVNHPGGVINYHEDSIVESPISGKRIATILMYLNDDYEGCTLSFPNLGIDINPKAGMMISYPLLGDFSEHDKRFGHAASEITSGKKIMCLFSLRERNI